MNEKRIPKATHFGNLKIGDTNILCANLEDGTRVLSRATFLKAIGRTGKAKGGREYDKEFKIPVFLTAKNLNPFIPNDLEANSKPILFKLNGQQAIGYKAELLLQVCNIFIDAHEAGIIAQNQKHIVSKCKILMRGFATVGLIALIDEATGYQEIRDKLALQQILEKYISKELLSWAKRFPDSFYQELFKLRGWSYSPLSIKRPAVVGRLTNNIVYERLAPGVLEELKKKNPVTEKGYRKHRHHQWLTEDVGHPALSNHLYAVIGFMRASANWQNFERLLDRAFPKLNQTLPLPFLEKEDSEEITTQN